VAVVSDAGVHPTAVGKAVPTVFVGARQRDIGLEDPQQNADALGS